MTTTHVARPTGHAKRPLLGLRKKPGRLALTFMRMPLRAYAHDQGHLLGHTFLQFTHVGRKSGKQYRAVAMVLGFDDASSEAVICAAWDTDWYHNLQARPATNVKIDRLIARILGWGDLHDDANACAFARSHRFVAFRPLSNG